MDQEVQVPGMQTAHGPTPQQCRQSLQPQDRPESHVPRQQTAGTGAAQLEHANFAADPPVIAATIVVSVVCVSFVLPCIDLSSKRPTKPVVVYRGTGKGGEPSVTEPLLWLWRRQSLH